MDKSAANASPLSTKLSASAGAGAEGGIFAQLTENPFFTAGFGLAALAAAARISQKGLRQGADLLRRRMLVDLEITRHDASYEGLLQWMTSYQRSQLAAANSPSTSSAPKGVLASLLHKLQPRLHHLQIHTSKQSRPDGAQHTHFSIVPGHGRHILRYQGSFILVNRQREKSFDLASGTPFETITMTTLYSQRHVFESMFAEAHSLSQQLHEGKTIIYKCMGFDWKPFGQPKRKRPLSSVVLEAGVKERIVADLESFISRRTWYLDCGVPYRRGYLLYGPPGTGKSSFIQAIAGHLDYSIAILNVAERGLTDDKLDHLLQKIPPRTMVLLEDVDTAFANRRGVEGDGYSGPTVTFSGLLNALDGIVAAEERIVWLTTNFVERLDAALVRPGRVDLTVRLGEARVEQIEALWERFYAPTAEQVAELTNNVESQTDAAAQEKSQGVDFGDNDPARKVATDPEEKARFIARCRELGLVGKVSPAMLQGLFLYHKDNAVGAREALDQLVVADAEGASSKA